MTTIYFEIVEINPGHCQITYSSRNADNQRIFHCLQDNGPNQGGIRLLRCTKEYEPSYEVSFNKIKAVFERPRSNRSDYTEQLCKLCNDWIDKYEKI